MQRLGLVLIVCAVACAAPDGQMGGTETETETDGSSGSDSSVSTTVSASVTMTTTMASDSNTTATLTTHGMTTSDSATTDVDPDTSGATATDATTGVTTGECPPGELGCPCDIGSMCEGDLLCVEGTCMESLPCDEPEGEPNDDEASAVELDEAVCTTPEAEAGSIDAGLNGAESDWFTFHADEQLGCFDTPHVVVTADSDLAVCIFASCDDGTASLGCSGGADESDSPDGAPGCCDQNEVGLNNFGCGFMNPDTNATIWVRVTSIEEACLPYSLAWEF
jgi:hypothetical protein